jgi:hypothetical protein
MKDLGNTFGGANSGAISINHAGHVVGWGQPAGDNLPDPQHASLWNGAFGTDCAFAVTINSKDQIAGASYPRAGATYPNCNFDLPARGFLYENGELVDLNNLVPPDSNLHISEPETINDRGEIAGLGIDASGNSRAFLLIPCDEHHPEVEGCDYDMIADTAAQVRPAQITGSSAAASDGKLAQAKRMAPYRSALTHRTQRVRSLAAE